MTMFNKVSKSFRFGNHDVTLTTGEIARQATGACICQMDDTVVLATVVAKKETKPGQDFFPLTVDYIEKTYAAGKIPGGFFKREGRPSEKETLTSRLIDRPIRPLFPDGFFNEVQVIIHVLSADPAVDPDIPAMIGASAALAISGIPFRGPIGACRVGYINDEIVINPTTEELKSSRLDLVVAGTERAVLMVESEADILPEKTMLEAVMAGHKAMQVCIQAINELVAEAGKPAWDWQPAPKNEALVARIIELCDAGLKEAYGIRSKQARTEKLREVYAACEAQLVADAEAAGTEAPDMNEVHGILFELEAKLVRSNILNGEPRIDGRDTRTVRPIEIRQSVLPRTHGSALFTRGETQALVLTTLGTKQDEQIIDGLCEETHDRFMLHYNMPPFATGETGRVGSPKRREIGHGRLAKRALKAVLPTAEEFQYTIRVVSEITESNGSSSMASVCGGCLSMLDAGVPLKDYVAGVAMGLIKEGNKFAVLTDILGDEDHLGDMDFKVAGTAEGVTALQMDIKIEGITADIMLAALAQAKPEIILLTGDLADSRRTHLAVALSFARQAAAIAPVYYVPGNHEARLAQYTAFAAALEAAGVLVLVNRALPLVRGSQRITIAGLADPGLAQRAGDPRPAEAILGDALAALRLSSQPFPLLLAHRPEWFPLYAEGGAALVFSGHAHGGQVRLPGIGGLFAPGQGLFPRYDGGLYRRGQAQMVVSRGLGNSLFPLRVGNRPEVVVATLHPAPSVEGQ